jgi:hypothetical protein
MLGKIAIFRGKSFEKSFFQEIPRNFPWKKMYEKSAPGEFVEQSPKNVAQPSFDKTNA